MTEDGELILAEENELAAQFSDDSIRRAFLRKVFLLLMILLAETAAYIAVCVYVEPVTRFWQENPLFILSSKYCYISFAMLLPWHVGTYFYYGNAGG